VSLTAVASVTEFLQDQVAGRVAEIKLSTISHRIRFPAAVRATPAVSLEAQDTESLVRGVVAALDGRAAAFVFPLLMQAAMFRAATAASQLRAPWRAARTEYLPLARLRTDRGVHA
jgi:hypothetical protein